MIHKLHIHKDLVWNEGNCSSSPWTHNGVSLMVYKAWVDREHRLYIDAQSCLMLDHISQNN